MKDKFWEPEKADYETGTEENHTIAVGNAEDCFTYVQRQVNSHGVNEYNFTLLKMTDSISIGLR